MKYLSCSIHIFLLSMTLSNNLLNFLLVHQLACDFKLTTIVNTLVDF